ncbi:MAG: hypothetical protein ACOYIS_06790 [Candidatus Cloacimonadaceae bacterium]|jgi:hypothetical protein
MVRYLLVLLLLFSVPIWAQVPDQDEEIQSPELIELTLDEIQVQGWQQDAADLLQQTRIWALENRLWWDGELESLHRFGGWYTGNRLDVALLHNWDNHNTHFGASLKVDRSGAIREMAVGNYRPRFGSGVSLGISGSGRRGPMFELGSMSPVDLYSPMGAAVIADIWELKAMAFGSIVNRPINVNTNNQVASFAKRKVDYDTLDRERIWGAALAYEDEYFSVGGMLYEQKHNWEHQNVVYKQKLLIPALAFKLDLNEFEFDLELGKIKKKVHAYAAFRYEHEGFKQQISMAKDPDRSKIAYSNFAQAVVRNPNSIELAYDALFPLAKYLKLHLLFSANQYQQPTSSNNSIKSRLAASLRYADKVSAFGIKVSYFDREVLSNIMQNYAVTRPNHWRFELNVNHKALDPLQIHLNCRYHIEDKKNYKNNGFYYNSGLRYKHKNVCFDAGYRACFRNKYGIYYLDESYEGWSMSVREDQQIYLGGKLDFHPAYVSLQYNQSIQHAKDYRIIAGLTIKY